MSSDLQEQKSKWQTRLDKIVAGIAYPVSGVMGFIFGHGYVSHKSSDLLKTQGGLDKEIADVNEKCRKLFPPSGVFKDIKDEQRERRREFREAKDLRFKQLGYRNMLDRFNYLPYHQKLESIAVGITAAGVALGAILTISNNKHLLSELSEKDKPDKDTGEGKAF